MSSGEKEVESEYLIVFSWETAIRTSSSEKALDSACRGFVTEAEGKLGPWIMKHLQVKGARTLPTQAKICPCCGVELSSLRMWSRAEELFEFSLDKSGNPDFSSIDSTSTDSDEEYQCVGCGTTLFFERDQAVAFLKGEKPDLQVKSE